jgi:hypothetical protein
LGLSLSAFSDRLALSFNDTIQYQPVGAPVKNREPVSGRAGFFFFAIRFQPSAKKLIFTGFTLIIQQFLFFWLATETLLSSNHKLINTV